MSRFFTFLLVFFVFAKPLPAQKLERERAKVHEALHFIYNAELQRADSVIGELEKRFPEHPSVPMLRALCLKWKYESKFERNKEMKRTLGLLARCTERAEDMLRKDEKNLELRFLALSGYGFMAEQYYRSGSKYKAVGKAKASFHFMKAGFSKCREYAEYFYTTGLYNYYRVVFPERHLLYRPFMWFFPSGDREKGLEQLRTASERSMLSKTEAYYYLVHLLMRYESQPEEAYPFARWMHEQYPENAMFQAIFAENAVLVGDWKGVRAVSDGFLRAADPGIRSIGEWLRGELAEKMERDYPKALGHYRKAAVPDPNRHNFFRHCQTLSTLGKARCWLAMGDREKAMAFVRQAGGMKTYFRTEGEIEGLKRTLRERQ